MQKHYNYYSGKNILIIGHTTKVGRELSKKLVSFAVKTYGFGLPQDNEVKGEKGVISIIGDVKNKNSLEIALTAAAPNIIFYFMENCLNKNRADIFESNIMGTVNLLELGYNLENLDKIIVCTNMSEEVDDIYIASKKATEIIVKSYESIFKDKGVALLFNKFTDIEELLCD